MSFNPSEHMIKLQQKDYLEVKWRVVWFREEHGMAGSIETELLHYEEGFALAKATVKVDGNVIATGIANADSRKKKVTWVGKEVMKAETAAIGRALAHAGYGTQFTSEEEGDFLADSPVEHKAPTAQPQSNGQATGKRWNEDAAQVTNFVGWCKDKMGEYNQSEMLQALNDALVTRVDKFVSMKQYPGDKEHAMHAIIAYETGYNMEAAQDTITRILPKTATDEAAMDNAYKGVKLAIKHHDKHIAF